jgi:hypothetical protein
LARPNKTTGDEWSGLAHEGIVFPQNILEFDAGEGNKMVGVCAPQAKHHDEPYIFTTLPQQVVDMYMHGMFVLLDSISDEDFAARRGAGYDIDVLMSSMGAPGRPNLPIFPGTISRVDGNYYDCECKAHNLTSASIDHGTDRKGLFSIRIDNRVEYNALGPTSGAPHREINSDALWNRTICTSPHTVVARYENELRMHSRHIARLGLRSDMDSPRQSASGWLVSIFAVLSTCGMFFGVWALASGIVCWNSDHPVIISSAAFARKIRSRTLFLAEVVLNRDLEE